METREYFESVMQGFNQNRNGRSLRRYCTENGIDYKWLVEYKKTYSASRKPDQSSPVSFTSLDVIDEKVSVPMEKTPATWSVSHLALSSPSGDIIEIKSNNLERYAFLEFGNSFNRLVQVCIGHSVTFLD